MPEYKRAYVPGGSFFFTLVTHRRRRFLTQPNAHGLLGDVIRECKRDRPFAINAIVLLPDHLHAIWTLPHGDSDYSARWGWIKKEFTKRWLAIGGTETAISEGRQREGRRGIWQPRFWEDDFERHFDYIHYNPVKHKLVKCPRDWQFTSFHLWVKQAVYPEHWACWNDDRELNFSDIESTVGE
jgi:putative transposase